MFQSVARVAKTTDSKAQAPKREPVPQPEAQSEIEPMLRLQRTVGNQAVLRMVENNTLQRKPADDQPSATANTEPDREPTLRKDYPISWGAENKFKSHLVHDTFMGISTSKVVEDNSRRQLNADGLRSILTDMTKQVLTPFEENMIANWNESAQGNTIVPIWIVGSGLFGYEIVTGGSGDRVHTVYSRLGEKIGETHSETALISEGLGPIDYVLAGFAIKNIGKFLLGKLLARRAAAKLLAKKLAEEGAEELGSEIGSSTATQEWTAQEIREAVKNGTVEKLPLLESEKQMIRDLEEMGYSKGYAEELVRAERSVSKTITRVGTPTKGGGGHKPGGGATGF